jgi:membrane protease YdiL (CAAX protease family)
MSTQVAEPLSFWRTVRLLLGVARRRTVGRKKRQRELLSARSKTSRDLGAFAYVFGVFFMTLLNGAAAFVVQTAVTTCQRIAVEEKGKIVVTRWFMASVKTSGNSDQASQQPDYSSEAKRIVEREGGNRAQIEQRLRAEVRENGGRNLIWRRQAEPGLRALATSDPLASMMGSLVLLLWSVMLVLQGEGLELDVQRRRHPVWEWLFSHPVSPGPVFLAEMLAPVAANPVYWTSPLFVGLVYSFTYGARLGVIAALVAGVPVSIAAACLGKALEIGVMLRFSPRTRGAIIGLMNWLGYASMMMFFVSLFVVPMIIAATWKILKIFAPVPWPWLRLFVGGQSGGSFSFLAGVATCLLVSAATIAVAVWFAVWGAQRGLAGNFGGVARRPSARKNKDTRFGKEPLYRKELLWFVRDRSAIIQTILIPLTVATVQVFNLRRVVTYAQGEWNYLCGAAILFATYFLWILGPKSLSSEGNALWIALTWPRGLESLLKAKAWLWSMISSGIVVLVMGYACFLFPAEIWKIALAGVGWFFFGRSMADKTVTLVTVASSSGEAQKIPAGRRWAAQLGMLTFTIGILTQQWHVALMGIVFSHLTAAAMWESFRARLPYLYDPWSEQLPPPPTLMQAMVSISILVEGGAILSALALLLMGRENFAIARAVGYGVCAVVVSFCVAKFLENRNVRVRDVWLWPAPEHGDEKADRLWRRMTSWTKVTAPAVLAGVGGGLLLGMFGLGYQFVLEHLPATAEMMRNAQKQMTSVPNLRASYFIMAVFLAPFAEEYLFRGLLYRALDREWGGWRAVVGSAAFFAIYHPPMAWIPVALVGAANAILFKKTGRLSSAVALHLVYNAMVMR